MKTIPSGPPRVDLGARPLTPANAEFEIDRLGFRWSLPLGNCIAESIRQHGVWELETTRLVADLVRPGMQVLDVGANFGYFTLLLARLVGPTGRVLAFEPVAEYLRRLEGHLRDNRLSPRVHLLPFGLSDRDSELQISVGDSSATIHWTGNEEPLRRERIRVRALDEITDELGIQRLDFVKVDVDGHEPRFLLGAAATLRRHRPWMSLEFAQHCLHVAGSDVRDEAKLVRDLGYVLCDEATRKPFASDMDFLVQCGNFDKSANVLAVPEERLGCFAIRTVAKIAELQSLWDLPIEGLLLEEDLDVAENECERFGRKRRDAELLCTVARNLRGKCLDIGTSHGRSAFRLATNVGDEGFVYTVNLLPEQHQGSGEQVTHLLPKNEIGSYFRERRIANVEQVFANTMDWIVPDRITELSIAFIDGCHDENAVFRDSMLAWDRLLEGGILLWHDFQPDLRKTYPWIDSVVRGVERFVCTRGIRSEILHLQGSWTGALRKQA